MVMFYGFLEKLIFVIKKIIEYFLINLDKIIFLIIITIPVYVLTRGKIVCLFSFDINLTYMTVLMISIAYSLITWYIKHGFVCGRGCYYSHLLTYYSIFFEIISSLAFSLIFIIILNYFMSYTKYVLITMLILISIAIAIGTIFSSSRYRQELLLKEYVIDTYNYVTFIYVYIVVGFILFYLFDVNVFDIYSQYSFLATLINRSDLSHHPVYLHMLVIYIVYVTILWILLSYNVLLNIRWVENEEKRVFEKNNVFFILVTLIYIVASIDLIFLFMLHFVSSQIYIIMFTLVSIVYLVFLIWDRSRDYPASIVDSFFLGLLYVLPMIFHYMIIINYAITNVYLSNNVFKIIFLLGLRLITIYILITLAVNISIFSSKRNFPIYEIYRMISRPLFIILVFAFITPLAMAIYFDNSLDSYILSPEKGSANLELIFIRGSLAYSSIISSVNMLMAEIYYTDKHLEERLNNYLRRFIDKLVSTMPPPNLLRFVIVGYGELGKRLVSGLFQHEIVSIKDPKVTEVMLISDKTTGAPRLVKYARCVKNVILIDKEYSEWYRTISHPVVGTVGVELVEYGYDERIYIPIIVNDITNDNVLNYIKLVGEWSSSPIKSIPKTMLFLAISDLNSLIRFLSKLSRSVTWQNIVVFYRILSSQQMTEISREVLEGKINGIYLDYIMGYNMGIPFIEFIKPYKDMTPIRTRDAIYLGVMSWKTE